MSIPLIINGVTWTFPQTGDTNWGVQVTGWATAVTNGMLQKAGGAFTLTAEVDFGANFGLMAPYYKSKGSNIAAAGVLRLANAQDISWRNNANGADLALSVNASDDLTFNGTDVRIGLIVNADVDAAAAIAFSKMAALDPSVVPVTDGSGFLTSSAVTAATLAFLDATSSVQTQLDAKLPLAGGTMTGFLTLNAAPTADLHAATKAYVDLAGSGLAFKESCRVATTTAGTLASDFEDGDTIDGVTLATGDRILIKDQADETENGIYVVQASGAPVRGTDADTWNEIFQAFVFITAGTANADTNWVMNQAAGGTIGVNDVIFVQQSAPGTYSADGEGIELTSTTFGLELDGTTLSKSGSGLKVNEIANAQIASAAAIAVNKLAALTSSRAVVSDGSGFIAAATTTAAQVGYLSTVTSDVQVQLDAKIAKTLTTTRGDMIYASAANTPARLAVGTSGYELQSDGTDPVWVDRKASGLLVVDNSSAYAIPTTWTKIPLTTQDHTWGDPPTIASGVITFIYTGKHEILVNIGRVGGGSSTRRLAVRLRNTTDGVTLDGGVGPALAVNNSSFAQYFAVLVVDITDVGKDYELQIAADGSGVTADAWAYLGTTANTFKVKINRLFQ